MSGEGGIFFRSGENDGKSRQKISFELPGRGGEPAVAGAHETGACGSSRNSGQVGAAIMEHRLDVVQIEDGGFAAVFQLIDIRSAPEMLRDSEVVPASGDGLFDETAETGHAVNQRGHSADRAAGIANVTGEQAPAVVRKRDDLLAADEAGRQECGRPAIGDQDEIDLREAGKVMEQGSDPVRSAALEGVWGLRRKHQDGHRAS